MPRSLWRSLDGPYVAPRPGDTVDLRGTTKAAVVQERKEILLSSYYAGIGSYYGASSSAVTGRPGRPWTFDRGVREGYQRVVWVYRAVRVIALSQSRLRFGVKDNDKEVGEGATEITGDPIIPLLNVRANPIEYAYQLREKVSTQWHLSPRGGFLEAVPYKNRRGISGFRLLPPGRTRIIPDGDGNIDRYEVDPLGGIGKPRIIDDPKRVRWFREPHPSDDFAGMTPLEAAGLSIEMDHFARLYNRQTMANDGRPAGIVGVTSPDGKGEPADEAELDRIERKFGGGPVDAGRLVVIDGTVTYTDVARSPRDLQWVQGRTAGRDEIFVAFGVPVSVAGDSSDRTFSNAGQEWVDFWTLTGVTHGDAFAWLFHDDVEGVPFLDYSKVEALQQVKQQRRAEWRDEVEAGVRTPLRYAQDTGQTIGDGPGEFPDVPATRALWLPTAGMVPVAATPEDQEAVSKLTPLGSGAQAAPLRQGAVPPDGGDPQDGIDGGGGFDGGPAGGGGFGDGAKAARGGGRHTQKLAAARAAERQGTLVRLEGHRQRRARVVHGDDDKEDHRASAAQVALDAQMTALAQRLVGVTLARVQGVKARMGTRHWIPAAGRPVSTKQLDAGDVVDPQQWYDQASAIAQGTLAPLAQQQYDATQAELAAEPDGTALVALVAAGVAAGVPSVGAAVLAAEVAALTAWLATSAANHGADLLERIRRAEADDAERVAGGGQPAGVTPIVDAIHEWAKGVPGWLAQVTPTSVAQAVEAGKHAVLKPLGDRVERWWRTRRDDKVRGAHAEAEGQVAKGGQPFVVGGEELRYPRDPKGSPGNVINCRCRTRWRVAGRAKALDGDVVADVLAMPTPSEAKARHQAGDPLPSHRWGRRVAVGGALSGVAGRDHVAEMLGSAPESKVRRVRTQGGVERFHEPVGSPIVAHPGLPSLGSGSHADAVAVSAGGARAVPAVHGASTGTETHPPGVTHFPMGDAAAIDGGAGAPDADAGTAGDTAQAKAELAAKGQDILSLIDKGMPPLEAEKEHARLLHNARFRYRRARLKAEKAAGAKETAAVETDVAQGPKEQTLADIGEALLKNPDAVDLDVALGKESGKQPLALYGATAGASKWWLGATPGHAAGTEGTPGKPGPGAVLPGDRWYDKLTADTDTPIPVVGIHLENGYVVGHGLAMRRGGVSYLVETPMAVDPQKNAAHAAVHAEVTGRLEQAATTYAAFLATVPEGRRGLQRGVALARGKNPADEHWAKEYGVEGFTSTATGGTGGTTWWNGAAVHPGLAAHEFGHNLDSGVHLPNEWLSAAKTPVLDGQDRSWDGSVLQDRTTQSAWSVNPNLKGRFVETRADPAHPITLDAASVTAYGAHSTAEDFAESVRLYLKDRRESKLGYVKPPAGAGLGTNVRFADLWPARARVLDAAFGLQSGYETPFVQQQRAEAAKAILDRKVEVYEATQTQGHVPEQLGIDDIIGRFGLSEKNAAAAWDTGHQQFLGHLNKKNLADALEHVKEQWADLGGPPDLGVKGEMAAELQDGFELTPQEAANVIIDAVDWHQQNLHAAAVAKMQTEAKLAAEQAAFDLLSLADLPKQLQTVIRKRRANVKLRAKQKGATAEQAEAIAAAYEAEQVKKEAKKLGLGGQLGLEIQVAPKVGALAAGPAVRVEHAGGSKGITKVHAWLKGAGKAKSPHAVSQHGGQAQQAKANIAGDLAAALNNEHDWELFRAYKASGAWEGNGTTISAGSVQKVPAFADTTPEQRQAYLDVETSKRIQMWASTSGDSNPFAVMMQQAVKDELGVPGPVGVNDTAGTVQKQCDLRYPHVAAFYRRFVRAQYEHTQAELALAGIEWVPVYRGMRINKGSHPWANNHDGVEVPLQPASSFSTASGTARSFSSGRLMMRGRVHRSMILGTARTGFGCLSESEWVVLAPHEGTASWQVRTGKSKFTEDVEPEQEMGGVL